MHATDDISGREGRPPEEAGDRDQVLSALLAAGGTADLSALRNHTGLSLGTLEDVVLYLDGEGLVRVKALDQLRARLVVSLTGSGYEATGPLGDRNGP